MMGTLLFYLRKSTSSTTRVDDLQANISYMDERMERTEKKVTQNNRRLEKLAEIGRRATAGDFARSG